MAMDRTLAGRYKALLALKGASAQERRKAGLEFEELLNALLDHEGLNPRIRYRPKGEEIDGSFVLESRVFLLEAKWHTKPLPASAIYAFRGKVEGKLSGTLGVFISGSGYSSHAVDALILGKTLNVILFDRQDLDAIFSQRSTFASIMNEKVRTAAEDGEVYLTRAALAERRKQQTPDPEKRLAAVVTEGRGDTSFLAEILERLPLRSRVPVVGAGGKMATARLANFLLSSGYGPARVIVVVDADGDVAGSRQSITELLESPERVDLVVVEDELESWIPKGSVRLERLSPPQIDRLVNGLDFALLKTRSESYRQFERFVLAAAGGA